MPVRVAVHRACRSDESNVPPVAPTAGPCDVCHRGAAPERPRP
ncbi:hypothetical protein T261_2043 [Streptomyces lydicus]|nr:hypothetical protein T261_2043 [Streptomyces lydicus]